MAGAAPESGLAQRSSSKARKSCLSQARSCEVVADGGEHGVCCIAAAADEIVAVLAVVAFQVADDGLDGRPSLELALDVEVVPTTSAFSSSGH